MSYPSILNQLRGYSDADQYVRSNIDKAIKELSVYYPKCDSAQSLNGIIGGKNKNYNVSVMNCNTHIGYYLKWKDGHHAKYLEDSQVSWHRTSKSLYEVLQDPFLENFISVYLSRTYFKKHNIK